MTKVSDISPKRSAMSPAVNPMAFATTYVREAVEARRSSGVKVAVAEVARFLGFSERRVRAIMHGEARQLLADEFVQLQDRQRAELEARLRRMDAEADIVRARLAEFGGA